MHATKFAIFVLAVSTLSSPASAKHAGKSAGTPVLSSHYGQVTQYKLGGDGGWDYLIADPVEHRLYISRGQKVVVVDTKTGQAAGEIPGTDGVHGIALDHGRGFGYTSNGKAGTITIFQLKDLKVVGEVPVDGQNPDAILFDPFSKMVFTFNGKSKNVSVIDPDAKKVVSQIALTGKPEFAASDERGNVYFNLEDESALGKINAKTFQLEGKFPLAPCEEPTGLSIDAKAGRLFAGCGNKTLAVIDANTGKVLQTLAVGSGVDATAFDPVRNLVFVSAGEGVLNVIKKTEDGRYEKAEDVSTAVGARTLAEESSTGRVYLATALYPVQKPEAGAKNGHHHRTPLPDTFFILVLGPTK